MKYVPLHRHLPLIYNTRAYWLSKAFLFHSLKPPCSVLYLLLPAALLPRSPLRLGSTSLIKGCRMAASGSMRFSGSKFII